MISPKYGTIYPLSTNRGEKASMLIEGNYKIIYVPAKNGMLVTAIAHTRRDPANWL
jgi:hypothetical protein